MTFKDAMETLPGDWLKFSGKAPRSEYWLKFLIMTGAWMLIAGAVALLTQSQGFNRLAIGFQLLVVFGIPFVMGLAWMVYAVPLTVRRVKDAGFSGWWVLVVAVLTMLLAWTWILAWLGALMNLAFILFCAFMPSREGEKSPQVIETSA